MSRKGRMPITIPKGVEIKLQNNEVVVKGPKGTLHQALPKEISLHIENQLLYVNLADKAESARNIHGLYRALIANLVIGVAEGFKKLLEMVGVGYRAAVQGKVLDLQIGNSHPTKLDIPEGVLVTIEKSNLITIVGSNKQLVGQFAATVRSMKPPEPYQGKGIRYSGEHVRKKAGKSAAAAKK